MPFISTHFAKDTSPSVKTFVHDSAVIGSNLEYAAIHQLGGQAGRNKKVTISKMPYLKFTENHLKEIITTIEEYLK